ncbi:hypothetical protein [Novosphingobium sp. Fuku2-ISO-50]|uniref:hypothetical protein n=1 Tax=Novosphingobium sp. Fuku2-ISO-50 TaxID=1739114 RepID=UPI0012E399D2|nr:hypothetical protein [Novosphingobium sp. Fuku2-ISO-50]
MEIDESAAGEVVNWANLRAIEWQNWPVFMSSIYGPIVLYYFGIKFTCEIIITSSIFWYLIVPSRFISIATLKVGGLIYLARFVILPIVAYQLWSEGKMALAIFSFFWPISGTIIFGLPVTMIEAFLKGKRFVKLSQIGILQRRILEKIGFSDWYILRRGYIPIDELISE